MNINLSEDTIKALDAAETKLMKLDAKLAKIIELQKPIIYEPRVDYFFALCRAVIGQQISVAAAAAILSRFEKVTALKPASVLAMTEAQVKEIGLSRQKSSYLMDIARHFIDNPNVYNQLNKLSDEAVTKELIQIKGIGPWSAQMFLMFTLCRLDVFPVDDVGIQRAMKILYGWKELPNKEKLEKVANKWKPYRTVACWHLWKSLRNSPA
jgi:DNA-3-methyladenine glycosylase II